MGKIIISESQYRKVKQALIERAISEQTVMSTGQNTGQNSDVDYKSLGIDPKNGTLKLQNDYTFESAQGSRRSELKLFKGAVFKPGKNFASNKILVSNTMIQKVGSISGGESESPRKSEVHYYCAKGKFNIPGQPDTYFNEDFPTAKRAFSAMCQLAKKPQVSTQGVAGQTTYNSKNPAQLIGKKDKNKKLTIPANTAFSFNEGKNGVGFKVNFQNGWFDCKTATFIINKEGYDSKFLADALSKGLCKSSGSVQTPPSSGGSSGGGGERQGGSGSGGSGSQQLATQDPIVSDMANYI